MPATLLDSDPSCEKLVLWNNHARSAALWQELRDEIVGAPGVELIETESPDDSLARAKAAAEAGVPMLIAAGGDGSVHTILQGMLQVETSTALGILPLGTGNDLCRTLQMPLEPRAAWLALQEGRTHAIDITRITSHGEVRLFSNSANGGNSSRLLECLDDEMKQSWGAWAYLRSALYVLADMQTYRVKLTFEDDKPEEYEAWNLVIANGNTAGGGLQVAPRASVTDGQLDVIVILAGTPFELAELATDLLAGDYLEHERVVYRRTRKVLVEISPRIELVVDGERLPGESFLLETMPQALQVVVGQGFDSPAS